MNAGHLIPILTILIHHTGFIVNGPIRNLSRSHDQRFLLLSAIVSPLLCLACTPSSTSPKPSSSPSRLRVFLSLSLLKERVGLLFSYLCWWRSFQVQSSTTFQNLLPARAEDGRKATLLCLWVDTWVNGMCTAGKMIRLQTLV